MKSIFTNTEGGKAGALDGLNLFFGALLGANLGTMDALPLYEYVKLVLILAGTVMALRMISTSERRRFMLAVVTIYGFLLVGVVTVPALAPKGMASADVHRLVATLAIWIVFVLVTELSPMEKKALPPDQA